MLTKTLNKGRIYIMFYLRPHYNQSPIISKTQTWKHTMYVAANNSSFSFSPLFHPYHNVNNLSFASHSIPLTKDVASLRSIKNKLCHTCHTWIRYRHNCTQTIKSPQHIHNIQNNEDPRGWNVRSLFSARSTHNKNVKRFVCSAHYMEFCLVCYFKAMGIEEGYLGSFIYLVAVVALYMTMRTPEFAYPHIGHEFTAFPSLASHRSVDLKPIRALTSKY